jgi:glycosyltransferase involved in cell wall biosynthesis
LVIGSPVLLANLFSQYKGPVSAIAGWQYGAKVDSAFEPPCHTIYLKMPGDFAQRVFDRFASKLLPFIKWFIKRQLKKEKPDAVLAVCPNGEFFISAYQACKDLGIPFMAHMHDLWEDNIPNNSPRKAMAKNWEPEILKNAHTVFCMTSVQQEFYLKKYGIKPELLPHTIRPLKIQDALGFDIEKVNRSKKKIIYTGNVSEIMNLDAIRQFVQAIPLLPESYEIKMFVSFPEDYCKKIGLYHPRIKYDWLPIDEVMGEMQDANILFLPLSFKNAAMDEVKTVFATKTLDYLISGSPIFVFSPSDSFHSISAKKGGWGYVLDIDSPEAIAKGLIELAENGEMATTIVENARAEALNRNATIYAEELYKYVQKI